MLQLQRESRLKDAFGVDDDVVHGLNCVFVGLLCGRRLKVAHHGLEDCTRVAAHLFASIDEVVEFGDRSELRKRRWTLRPSLRADGPDDEAEEARNDRC